MSLTQDATELSDIEELDWTQLLDAYDYARPQRGELREGVVMQIEENGILVRSAPSAKASFLSRICGRWAMSSSVA